MLTRLKTMTATLNAWQVTTVLAVFVLTAVGAFALAYGFAWWNQRKAVG